MSCILHEKCATTRISKAIIARFCFHFVLWIWFCCLSLFLASFFSHLFDVSVRYNIYMHMCVRVFIFYVWPIWDDGAFVIYPDISAISHISVLGHKLLARSLSFSLSLTSSIMHFSSTLFIPLKFPLYKFGFSTMVLMHFRCSLSSTRSHDMNIIEFLKPG